MLPRQVLPTELLLNEDGSVYHLSLLPEELADIVFLVGDPFRAAKVSAFFDRVDIKKQKREFVTHTGMIGRQQVSVVATGIGTGNIDIVLNEMDALKNIDLATRTANNQLKKLTLIRLGTCGSLAQEVRVDNRVISSYAFAFDGLLKFYQQVNDAQERQLLNQIHQHFHQLPVVDNAYAAHGAQTLVDQLAKLGHQGITLTCSGFYGPQHRCLRIPLIEQDIFELSKGLQYQQHKVVNLEMETAAIYGLARLLGHDACSISTVIANRINQRVSQDPARAVRDMVEQTLAEMF